MRNEHILDILDEKVFGELNEPETTLIKIHTAKCFTCMQAFEAAKLTSQLLKTGINQNFEPSAFFQARVMANLRDKQAKISPLFAFARMWRASGTLVAMMITTVLALVALTVFAPDYGKVAAVDNDSTDFVILDEKMPTKEPSNDQIFQMVAGAENNQGK